MSTRRARPSEPSGFVPMSRVAAPVVPIGPSCGAVKVISGAPGLRCTLPAGHQGDHGQHYAGALVIRWSR